MGHHRENCLKCPTVGKLYPAMTSLGFNKFKIILLEIIPFNDKEELKSKEIEWILKLDTINNGYNTMLKDGHLPKESKEKCAKSLINFYKNKNPEKNVGISKRCDIDKRNGRINNRWICYWSPELGVLKSKSFNVEKYGENEAKQLAINYRSKMIDCLEKYN
jgi:hypothetical protein